MRRLRLVLAAAALWASACGSAVPTPPLPPVPVITSISPATFAASTAPRTLTVTGTGFDGGSGAFALSMSGPLVASISLTPASATEFKMTCAFITPGTYGLTMSIRGQESNQVQWNFTAPPPAEAK